MARTNNGPPAVLETASARREQGIKLGGPSVLSEDVADRMTAMRLGGTTLTAIGDRLIAEVVPTARGQRPLVPRHGAGRAG